MNDINSLCRGLEAVNSKTKASTEFVSKKLSLSVPLHGVRGSNSQVFQEGTSPCAPPPVTSTLGIKFQQINYSIQIMIGFHFSAYLSCTEFAYLCLTISLDLISRGARS